MQMFFKIDVAKNFENFTEKHLRWKILKNFIKKRLQERWFLVKFLEFLRTPSFTEHLWWLFLERVCQGTSLVKILQSCHFNIFGNNHRCFRKILIKLGFHHGDELYHPPSLTVINLVGTVEVSSPNLHRQR